MEDIAAAGVSGVPERVQRAFGVHEQAGLQAIPGHFRDRDAVCLQSRWKERHEQKRDQSHADHNARACCEVAFAPKWRSVSALMETRILPTVEPAQLNAAAGEAVRLLAAGEVVALPTETVYGLAADALNASAVAKIFEAKERPSFDPLIVHLPHKKDLDTVADVPESIAAVVRRLAERFWPGPLTLLLPKKDCIPDIVTAGLPTVAVRASANYVFNRVARNLERPLAAPSANRFGSISPTSASAVMAELGGRIPLILDDGGSAHGLESTIIKIEPGSPKPRFIIMRPGPITQDDLKEFGVVVLLKNLKQEDRPESPGLLASHYAPRTPLRLLESPDDFVPEAGKTLRAAQLPWRCRMTGTPISRIGRACMFSVPARAS